VSDDLREDSIAVKLEGTRWEYSQSDDQRFLLDPIGKLLETFRWNGEPRKTAARQRDQREDPSHD